MNYHLSCQRRKPQMKGHILATVVFTSQALQINHCEHNILCYLYTCIKSPFVCLVCIPFILSNGPNKHDYIILACLCEYKQKSPMYHNGPEGWAHWGHSPKQVHSEQFSCVGNGTASSVSRYYRKGNVCDHFFATYNDTEWVHNREPQRSQITSQCHIGLISFRWAAFL